MNARRPALTGVVAVVSIVLGAQLAVAQSSGRFPESGSHTAIVTQYSMSGVAVTGKPSDNGPSMEWHRSIAGKVTGGRIGVSATVTIVNPGYPRCNQGGGGFYFTTEAVVSAGRARKTFTHPASGKCQDAVYPVTVNLALDVPDDASEARISVRTTYVNPMYGNRASVVKGAFTATPRAAGGGQDGGRSTPTHAPPTPVGGDDEGTDGTGDDIPPWVKVLGGAVALAAGVAAIVRILSSRRARKPSRPPQFGYILQLSAEEIQIEEGKPATVSARVWRVDEQGATSPVPDATLAVASPDPALQVNPGSGKGTIECTVALVRQPGSPTIVLTVTSQAGGQTVQASVRVVIQPLRLGAWVAGLKEADAFFDARARAWGFRDVVAFFHDTSEKPCTPPAGCTFQVAAVPDVLEAAPARSDDGLTWTFAVRLRPGTDLDAHLGPLLQRYEGRIKATVTATAADGRVFASTVAYRLRPTLTVFLRAFDRDPQREDGHEYAGAVLPPGELVADGRDAVHLVAFACRTDLADDPQRAFERRFPAALDLTVELTGRDADAFQVCPPARLTDPALAPRPVPEGCTAFAVSARRPILHDGRTREVGARLRAKLLDSRHTSGYEIAEDAVEITLSVDPVHLALWVLPGEFRGTSEAWAFASAALSHAPWVVPIHDLPLELDIEQPGNGARLDISGGGPTIHGLSHVAGAVTANAITGRPKRPLLTNQALAGESQRDTPPGVAGWLLCYSGMTWKAAPSTVFTVKCRCAGGDEAVAFPVDVGENGRQFSAALDQAATTVLDCNNPEFVGNTSALSYVDYILRDECRGAVYDARDAFARTLIAVGAVDAPPGGLPAAWTRYTCGSYRERITAWMLRRRHLRGANVATALQMNGIEVCQYVLLGLHDFCGIHLSGTGVNDDPVFIDPWWEQCWNAHATGAGWYTQFAKAALVVTILLAEALVIGGLITRLVLAVGCRVKKTAYELVGRVTQMLRERLMSGRFIPRMPALPALPPPVSIPVLPPPVTVPPGIDWLRVLAVVGFAGASVVSWITAGAYKGSDDYTDDFSRYQRYEVNLLRQLLDPLVNRSGPLPPVQPLLPWGP
ncbi:MAG: hypothetical protein MUF10_14625 [Thermoanaerobaculaceae bacterium]|jgi:hypothetical protein|nr:hypothetical protein [Thermoanaerobaculaceae bacterium]